MIDLTDEQRSDLLAGHYPTLTDEQKEELYARPEGTTYPHWIACQLGFRAPLYSEYF